MPDPRGYVSAERVRDVIDECAREPSFTSLVFTGYGEPLMHPDLCELSRYAKDQGVPIVRTYTNCKTLDERGEAILTEGAFDEITLSLNGVSNRSYLKIKGEDDYERVAENVRRFLRRKRELGLRRPFVNLTFLALGGESYDLEELAAEWRPLLGPGDCVRLKPSHNFAGQVRGRHFGGVAPDAPRVPCGQLWNLLHVARAGQVSPCAVDPFKQLAIGDASTTSLRRIWESDALAKLRGRHEAGEYDQIPLCDGCETWRYFTTT
jgi:radical SAM protein with 4Fe4S-binding SPASM domain